MIPFEWHEEKAQANLLRHGVSFDEADASDLDQDEMRPEYDFSSGMRGKHHQALREGYSVTVYHADGSTTVKEYELCADSVRLEPDVRAYFPDSESVNRALRGLIALIPQQVEQ